MKFFKPSLFLGFFLLAVVFVSDNAFAYTNLLVNPGGETDDMTGWTVTSNGGDGWATNFDEDVRSGISGFQTSYGWDIRHQTVDLLEAGFTEEQLDSGDLNIFFGEWIKTRGDQGGRYFLNFKLLAENGTTVLDSHSIGSQGSPIWLLAGVDWFQESHLFENIPSGTRYAYFEDGGIDVSFWAGHFGTHFDDAAVAVISDAPTSSLGLGTYHTSQSTNLGATGSTFIRYTIDGTFPTCSTGNLYGGAVSLFTDANLQVVGCDADYVRSVVSSFSYSVNSAGGTITHDIIHACKEGTCFDLYPTGSDQAYQEYVSCQKIKSGKVCAQEWAIAKGYSMTLAESQPAIVVAPKEEAVPPTSTLSEDKSVGLVFSDVPADHPYQTSIAWAKESGMVQGYPDGSFHPEASINRAEFVKIISGESDESCESTKFSDVPNGEWFTPFICRAVKENIVNGYPDGTFRPAQTINFAEAAKIIVEALGISVTPDSGVWYRPYIQALKDKQATPVTVQANDQLITRGEMLYMLDHLQN